MRVCVCVRVCVRACVHVCVCVCMCVCECVDTHHSHTHSLSHTHSHTPGSPEVDHNGFEALIGSDASKFDKSSLHLLPGIYSKALHPHVPHPWRRRPACLVSRLRHEKSRKHIETYFVEIHFVIESFVQSSPSSTITPGTCAPPTCDPVPPDASQNAVILTPSAYL